MPNKYHWMSMYTGEIATTIEMFAKIIWMTKNRKQFPNVCIFKYAVMWKFSAIGY